MTGHRHHVQRVFYLTALFAVGVITGALLAWSLAPAHRAWGTPPSREHFAEHLRDEFRRELQLTPAQVEKLGPVIEHRIRVMEVIHSNTVQQIESSIRSSDAELTRALGLSPDQCARLEEMDRRRREMFQQKGPPPPPPGR